MFALFLLLLLPASSRGSCVDGERVVSRDTTLLDDDTTCEVCPDGESSISGDENCYKVADENRICIAGWYGVGWCEPCPDGTTSTTGAVKIQECTEIHVASPDTDPGTDLGTDPDTDPDTDPGTDSDTDPGTDSDTDHDTDTDTDPGADPDPGTGHPRPALGNLEYPRTQSTPSVKHYNAPSKNSTPAQLVLIITLLILLVVVTITAISISWRRANSKIKQNLLQDDLPSHSMSTELYYQLSHVPSDISSNVFESEAAERLEATSRLGSEVFSRRGTYDVDLDAADDHILVRSDSNETLYETSCEPLDGGMDSINDIMNHQSKEEDYVIVNPSSVPDIIVEMHASEEGEWSDSLLQQRDTLSTESDFYEFCKNVVNKTLGW